MKNFYNFLFIFALSPFTNFVSAKNVADFAFENQQQELPSSVAVAYYPVTLTGFNHDVVANGPSQANASTTATIDFSNEFYSADFVPTTSYNGASAAAVGGGLPANGQIASAVTAGVTYQLADYATANSLLLRPIGLVAGTLNFTQQYTANSIYILWVATEAQANTVGITINFADGTNQVFLNQVAYDWVGGNTGVALSGLGRVGSGTTQWAQLNEFSELGACKLFEKKIDLSPANQAKAIAGITFVYSGFGDYQSLSVFAVNVFGEPYLGVGSNLRNQVAVYPNPSNDIFNVQSDFGVKNISVANTLGQTIKSSDSDAISLSGFPNGIYFLEITFENDTTEIRRIIKK
ncbi:T9SS type A sorting domain-containing protein [Flavobacterium sp.]|uniref:T9SS type A sorting domain-containing protein n=1 Tax=Flavobacterium sp. TaxID=239 RepID=UPI0011FB4466|nr:T9SS type A sorting domain-containing protein [Flavobacterium sp.]RZJ70143.1 MAG: T9SS type A sorting domain-containing protein [Flavobacterium sp.]